MPTPPDRGGGLVATGVRFTYPGEPAPVLVDVDVMVAAGRSLGVLGPNGAGKSTLLGVVTGTLAGEVAGLVTVAGDVTFPRSALGYAPQDIALYELLTVEENLRHVARLTLPRRQVAGAVARAVDDYGLADIAGRRVHRLSGGQRRLAHLATAFVHRPPVRILDEPTNALDFTTRLRLVDLVARWRAEGVAVMVTAHYPEDIEDLCTDLVLLRDGRCRPLGELHAFLGAGRPALRLVGVGPAGVADGGDGGGTGADGTGADGGGRADEVVPLASPTVGGLAEALGAVAGPDRAVRNVELTGRTLRGLLLTDPELRAYVTEDDDR